MRFSLFLATAAAALLAACQQGATPKADQAESQADGTHPAVATLGATDTRHKGMAAPDLPLETGPDGHTTSLVEIIRENPDRPVLVNLWATWCAPCVTELPTLDKLQAESGDRLLVVPVSQDMEGWRVVSDAFTKERYPHLETLVESKMALGLALKAEGLPLTILYDSDGKEVWRLAGGLDWSSDEARGMIGL